MKPPLPAILYGTGLLLAFGAGWLLKAGFPASEAISAHASLAEPPAGTSSGKPLKRPRASGQTWQEAASGDLLEIKAAMQPGVVNQLLIDKLDAVLSLSDPSVRNPRWQTVLTAMRAEDAAAVKALFHAKAKDGRHFDSEFEAFCHRWGQVDGPAAAQSIVSEYAGKESIVRKVMNGWGSQDAAAALAWINNQSRFNKGAHLNAIVEGLGQRSASAAEAFMLAHAENPAFEEIQGRLAAMKVAEAGLSGALPWFDHIASGGSPDKFKQANLGTLLKITNQATDSSQSIQLVRKYADRAWLPASAGDVIGLAYLGEDPAASLDGIGKMPSLEARASATRVILSQWGPEFTSQWLVAHPQHPLFETGALHLVQDLAKTDPEAATAWASQIKDQKMLSFAKSILSVETARFLRDSRRDTPTLK